MRRELLKPCIAVVGLLACTAIVSAQPPEEPARPLPPPPMPMAGRVFPVYPLYPAYGAVPLAYAGETFVAADRTGYFQYAAPVNYWSVPDRGWKSVPHPQAAEVAARFGVGAGPSLYDAGCTAYWSGDYRQAAEYLAAAVARNPNDARAWQYLALSRWALGQEEAAREAARQGAAAAVSHPEENAGHLAALERVQGPARRWLASASR
jgi:hypothetical protein